jgi:hypothetical protein
VKSMIIAVASAIHLTAGACSHALCVHSVPTSG